MPWPVDGAESRSWSLFGGVDCPAGLRAGVGVRAVSGREGGRLSPLERAGEGVTGGSALGRGSAPGWPPPGAWASPGPPWVPQPAIQPARRRTPNRRTSISKHQRISAMSVGGTAGPGGYLSLMTAGPLDTFHRPLRDLRVSVTDRCNFRCVYCMPKEVFGKDFQFLPRADILSFEEIERLVRVFVGLGVRKVRLTGGEPLVRRNIERLVEMLARIGDLDLTLTTNGSLLAGKAKALGDAGLGRVTVSLDSLDDEVFRRMNDVDFPVARVLEGMDAAEAAGLAPLKVNMVVKRGLNEDSVLPMARHFRGTGRILRFIEYMDVGSSNGWRLNDVVSAREIVATIDRELPLEPIGKSYPGEVAERWRYRDGTGEIGVIASVTQAFCADCTRARLSADGSLYTCLFAMQGHDLRGLIRGEATDVQVADAVAAIWTSRDDRYSERRSAETAGLKKIEMSFIGG
jgi:cyclic pyranopterin phosphate synthase